MNKNDTLLAEVVVINVELVHDEDDRGERVLGVVKGRPEDGDDAVVGCRRCAVQVAGAEGASSSLGTMLSYGRSTPSL